MPIYTVRDALVVELGLGDVVVAPGKNNATQKFDELLFWQDEEPHAVGEFRNDIEGENTDTLKVPLRIYFGSLASLDVVLERLTHLRSLYTGEVEEAVNGTN